MASTAAPIMGSRASSATVALAVVGRNLHRLGALLLAAEAERWRGAERQRAA